MSAGVRRSVLPRGAGHSIAAMTSGAAASVPTAGAVVKLCRARERSACARSAGLTRISQFPGNRGFSQAAMRRACSGRARSARAQSPGCAPRPRRVARESDPSSRLSAYVSGWRSIIPERSRPGSATRAQETNNGQGRRNLQNHGSDRNERKLRGRTQRSGRFKRHPRPCATFASRKS